MCKNNEKSIRRVSVTVATELEPVTVCGQYAETDDGFTLEFDIGNDKFFIANDKSSTTVRAQGVMSYDIELKDAPTSTALSTPYGMVKFNVKTVMRKVSVSDSGVRILIGYILSSDAAGEIARTVDVCVDF